MKDGDFINRLLGNFQFSSYKIKIPIASGQVIVGEKLCSLYILMITTHSCCVHYGLLILGDIVISQSFAWLWSLFCPVAEF